MVHTGQSSHSMMHQKPLFISGENGYHTYRIPALVVTTRGTVLAFCEGRRTSPRDMGDIAILVKRSCDHGRTWSEQEIVWDDPEHTCGNPCPVVDRESGTVWLLMTWNRGDDPERKIIDQTSGDTRRVFVTSSRDDGKSWALPEEITAEVKCPGWTWYATGPGAGVQIERGPHRGRLLIPCDHIEAETRHYYSHVIASDDHGETWRRLGRTPQHQVNECEVVELNGNRLMLNMRNYDRSQVTRKVSISDDGGATWDELYSDPALIEPICQASIRRFSRADVDRKECLLFSNPASDSERRNMTVRLSEDGGKTWPYSRVLHPGPSAYSCLTVFANDEITCLYEAGEESPYESLVLARFTLQDLMVSH